MSVLNYRINEELVGVFIMKAKQVTIDESRLNTITCDPLPGSRKIYLPGKIHPSLRVPVREISQTPTQQSHSSGKDISLNPSVISKSSNDGLL